MTEKIVESVKVFGHGCFGCQQHNRDVMVKIQDAADVADGKFIYLFFTEEQALQLVKSIMLALGDDY